MATEALVVKLSAPFSRHRGNCQCPNLMPLWEQMAETDRAEAEARRYAEQFAENPEKYKRDVIFQDALIRRRRSFELALELYRDVFAQAARSKGIIFESGGRVVEPDIIQEGQQYTMNCSTCRTEIPFVEYEGWNQ